METKDLLKESESNYRKSRKLQDRLMAEVSRLEKEDAKSSKILKLQFSKLVIKNNEPLQREEFDYHILKDLNFWDAALWQRQIFSEVKDYYSAHTTFHNAYQLAIYILYIQYSGETSVQQNWHFRGQGERWPVVPTIFRSKQPFKKELENLFSVATAIMQEMGCTFNEAVAIAQHYRDDDVNTWLIDVTTDHTRIGQIIKDTIAKNAIVLTSNISFSFQLHAKDYMDLMQGWLKQKVSVIHPEWEIYIKTMAFVQEKLVGYYESLSNDSKEKASLLPIISLHQMKHFCKTLSSGNFPDNNFAHCAWVNNAQIARIVLTLIANEIEGEEVNLIREVIFKENPSLSN